jgi:TRAP-type C4-dicarboxylate transport system substrate-binding protein
MKTLSFIIFLSLSLSLQAKKIKVKFGTAAPPGTPWADMLDDIKKRVTEESSGQIKIKNFLGGALGGELEIIQKIRRGNIQGGGVTLAALASVIPELDVLEIPFLFKGQEEADYILDNVLFDKFAEILAKKDLILVTWAENGWRSIGHKSRAILTPADMKNVKIRSQESKVHLAFWNNMGASPVPIALPEVLPALQTGVVKSFDNTPLFLLAAEWHSTIKHFSLTKHIYQAAAVVYSKKFWDKLSDENRKILLGPGKKLAIDVRKGVRELEQSLLGVLKESGVKVHTLNDQQRNAFEKVMHNQVDPLLRGISGEAKVIYDLVQNGKDQFQKVKL